jgi:hypothetical protein
MALTPEKKVKNKVVAILKQRKAYYFFPATYGMGRSGIPDVVCCYGGYFIGIECKAGDNTPTTLQERELAAIKAAGGFSCVINETNTSLLINILDNVIGTNTHEFFDP